jgi:hypothetical protein
VRLVVVAILTVAILRVSREPLLLMLGHLTANLRETVKNQQPAAAALPLPQPLQWGLPIAERQATAGPVQKLRPQRIRARK